MTGLRVLAVDSHAQDWRSLHDALAADGGNSENGDGSAVAVGWRGTLTDEQSQVFATDLYRRLVQARTVGDCFDHAALTVTARWPGLATPHLYGDASAIPLP